MVSRVNRKGTHAHWGRLWKWKFLGICVYSRFEALPVSRDNWSDSPQTPSEWIAWHVYISSRFFCHFFRRLFLFESTRVDVHVPDRWDLFLTSNTATFEILSYSASGILIITRSRDRTRRNKNKKWIDLTLNILARETAITSPGHSSSSVLLVE